MLGALGTCRDFDSVVAAVRRLDPDLAARLRHRVERIAEGSEYADAAIECRAWDAALVDVDRVVAELEAVETMLRRELPIPRTLTFFPFMR